MSKAIIADTGLAGRYLSFTIKTEQGLVL